VDSLAVMAVQYGTVPDWIAGIGTAFATIVAALAVNREVQRRRQEQASEFSHQARRVLCWLAVIEVPEYEGRAIPKMPGSSSNPTLGIIIHNGSEEPVVDFKAEVETDPALLRGVEHWEDHAPTVVEEPIVPPGDMQRAVTRRIVGGPLLGCGSNSPTPTALDVVRDQRAWIAWRRCSVLDMVISHAA
jgi:hypothetical protein